MAAKKLSKKSATKTSSTTSKPAARAKRTAPQTRVAERKTAPKTVSKKAATTRASVKKKATPVELDSVVWPEWQGMLGLRASAGPLNAFMGLSKADAAAFEEIGVKTIEQLASWKPAAIASALIALENASEPLVYDGARASIALDRPVLGFEGISSSVAEVLSSRSQVKTVRQLASWIFYRVSLGLFGIRAAQDCLGTEVTTDAISALKFGSLDALESWPPIVLAHSIEQLNRSDKPVTYGGKPARALLDTPVGEVEGIPARFAKALIQDGMPTLGKLARWSLFHVMRGTSSISEAETIVSTQLAALTTIPTDTKAAGKAHAKRPSFSETFHPSVPRVIAKTRAPVENGKDFQDTIFGLLATVFPMTLGKAGKAQSETYEMVGPAAFTARGLEALIHVSTWWHSGDEPVVRDGKALLFSREELEDEMGCTAALSNMKARLTKKLGKGRLLGGNAEEFRPLVFAAADENAAYAHWRASQPVAGETWFSALRKHTDLAVARFPAVEAKFSKVYNLKLPRHVAAFVGFKNALEEVYGGEFADTIAVRTAGILEWFDPKLFNRKVIKGLDERLHYRYFGDPPEFVTVATGDTDGLHWGLWYDDTTALPTEIVHNYARCERETVSKGCLTLLDAMASYGAPESVSPTAEYLESYPFHFRRRMIVELIEDARDRETELLALDGLDRDTGERFSEILGGVCPSQHESGISRSKKAPSRSDAYKDNAQVKAWINDARARLEQNDPSAAWVVGHELYWLGEKKYENAAIELLSGAYTRLNRPQLADILRVHHAHRDLASVDVYR